MEEKGSLVQHLPFGFEEGFFSLVDDASIVERYYYSSGGGCDTIV